MNLLLALQDTAVSWSVSSLMLPGGPDRAPYPGVRVSVQTEPGGKAHEVAVPLRPGQKPDLEKLVALALQDAGYDGAVLQAYRHSVGCSLVCVREDVADDIESAVMASLNKHRSSSAVIIANMFQQIHRSDAQFVWADVSNLLAGLVASDAIVARAALGTTLKTVLQVSLRERLRSDSVTSDSGADMPRSGAEHSALEVLYAGVRATAAADWSWLWLDGLVREVDDEQLEEYVLTRRQKG